MILYEPKRLAKPARLINVPTAWDEMESALEDIIERFAITPTNALEFGVDYGYSTAALANYFTTVYGVDTFKGDVHAGFRVDMLPQTEAALKDFPNIRLCPMDYRDWAVFDNRRYDLIHVDIVHTYEDTYACGAWAVEHADVVIFHDTIAFSDVMRAVEDLASNYGRFFYQWAYRHGLGILSKREIEE